jgi:hypothetical protein
MSFFNRAAQMSTSKEERAMKTDKPSQPTRSSGQAANDKASASSSTARKPGQPERDSVAKQIEKDNERIQKGAP